MTAIMFENGQKRTQIKFTQQDRPEFLGELGFGPLDGVSVQYLRGNLVQIAAINNRKEGCYLEIPISALTELFDALIKASLDR